MPDILPDESFDETRKCRLAPPSPVGWGQVVHLSTLFITFHARRGGTHWGNNRREMRPDKRCKSRKDNQVRILTHEFATIYYLWGNLL